MIALIFDTETTGLLENRLVPLDQLPEVIEICAFIVDLDTGEILSELDTLCKPNKPIPHFITKITGIDDDMVRDAKPFREVAVSWLSLAFSRCDVMIAHGCRFDRDMIFVEFSRAELFANMPRMICTMEETVHLVGRRLTLNNLHEHLFGLRFNEAHRARPDTEALMRCVLEMKKRELI